ncbi:MAG: hypothetical protein ILA34_04305 [Bacteroidaceae bacterium]|nr:hypothetical protein [Bacteroidaceae bacterium]
MKTIHSVMPDASRQSLHMRHRHQDGPTTAGTAGIRILPAQHGLDCKA